MFTVMLLLIGFIAGILAAFLWLNSPVDTEWRKDGTRWKRKRHGRWEYTDDKQTVLHG